MQTVIILVLASLSMSAMAEIYKWTDANGNVHYGDKPVKHAVQMQISDEKQSGSGLTSAQRKERRQKLLEAMQEDRKLKEKQQAEQHKKREKLNRQCVYAKDQLKQYKKVGRLYTLDKQGNRVYMSDQEHDRAVAKLQAAIKQHCK